MVRKYIETFSQNYEKVNDEFVKCTIAVMSCDQIANGTKFIRAGVDKASSTLDYAPLIGYFNGDKGENGDFEGHGQEMVWTDNGIEFKVKTIPFGVAIKGTQRWEKIQKPNGEFEDYFCVDAYMWARYEEATQKVKDNKCNQSMEVKVISGQYQKDYYEIDEFAFEALCILGEDVTPAFNLAKVRTSDKFEKDGFKAEYSEMVQALNKYLEYGNGGENVEDEDKKIDETTTEEITTEEVVEATEENGEVTTETPVEGEENAEAQAEAGTESTTEDYEAKFNELSAQHETLSNENTQLKESFSALEGEVVELRNYKENNEKSIRMQKEEALFAQFEEIESNEEFVSLKGESVNYSLDELEIRCFAILGKSKLIPKTNQQTKKFEKKAVFNHVETGDDYKEPVKGKYDDIITKYKNR